jgi:hypothetical protein
LENKHKNADLNLETIPVLTGYFIALEDPDQKREKPHYKPYRHTGRSSKTEKDRV